MEPRASGNLDFPWLYPFKLVERSEVLRHERRVVAVAPAVLEVPSHRPDAAAEQDVRRVRGDGRRRPTLVERSRRNGDRALRLPFVVEIAVRPRVSLLHRRVERL